MAGSEIHEPALDGLISNLTTALQIALRLSGRCESDNGYHGANAVVLGQLRHHVARAYTLDRELLKFDEPVPPLDPESEALCLKLEALRDGLSPHNDPLGIIDPPDAVLTARGDNVRALRPQRPAPFNGPGAA